ncbi:carboxyl-terminal processing protease [Carboxydocella sporoproducens DSM 16521]|uniref:Carboxyl-terminal processing protease n=2 Tax=Carboxydocella TaxID=178898 RepID=A0A1T4PZQ0_9FIRM|nr:MULTISPECIES: S41 family peptidase [Carboxydocella]AVX21251.1 carboxyl-terminal processing protease [Carboxydocella thermautotrophica]AVX31683.1 carboxyl-terminal processing protease [Carboxydocella thermautotrophica]SJZ96806.1 carboxyl-terminal processing protease [Carboxydocella sporoproducens DSM 16521]
MKALKRIILIIMVFLSVVGLVALPFLFAIVQNWTEVRHLLQVVDLVEENYIEPVNSGRLVEGAAKGIVEALDDPYSVYMDSKTFKHLQEQISGAFGGVGIQVAVKDKHITVIAPIKGTPAYRAGIKAGDVIAKINGEDALDMDIERAVQLLRGKPGTTVKITVVRKNESKPLEFTLTREIINVPSVDGKLLPDLPVAYISISMFNEHTGDELVKVLNDLKTEGDYKGIILDLRDNPGGELTAAVKVADQFIGKGPVVTIRDRKGVVQVEESDAGKLNLPLVVLVNGNSASASEIVAGAIQDYQAGVLVGTRTFGKGVVQTIYPIDNTTGLKLTTSKYFTPKGRDIHKKGITPDIVVEQPENGEDLQLAKAKEIIRAKLY